MVELRKIQPSIFANLHDAFLREDDPLSSEQDWRNVFDYQWSTEFDHCGYALLDRDAIVGMIGMVFSERRIAGEIRRLCNLHTWWVHPDHRGRSLALLRPVLKLDDYTITHFTPDDEVRAVATRLGFKTLSSRLKILLPVRKDRRLIDEERFLTDPHLISDHLDSDDRKIHADHQPYGLHHLVIKSADAYCYIVYALVIRHRLPYCHIHYISDQAIYEREERPIRAKILSLHRANFIAVDDRLVPPGRKFRRSFDFWAPAHGLYKSSDLQPAQIDHLYSDVVFLKLTVLPDISHELGRVARKLLPFSN